MSLAFVSGKKEIQKWLDPAETTNYGFYRGYGLQDELGFEARTGRRRKDGLICESESALFSFQLQKHADNWQVSETEDCEVLPISGGWKLRHATWGEFQLLEKFEPAPLPPHDQERWKDRRIQMALLASLFLAIGLGVILSILAGRPDDIVVAQDLAPPPVMIELAQKPPPPPPEPVEEKKPVDEPLLRAKRAVTKNLGFLKLLGSKEFKKQVGGIETTAKIKSAGAGAGGSEGSGGEVMAALGKGLHAATIGSTGAKGLGGIGTKGAGGGQGGYGELTGGARGSLLSNQVLAGMGGKSAGGDVGLDREQILATIQRYLSQVRACYEDGLKRIPTLVGQVGVSFEINSLGRLSFSRVQRSSLNDRNVEECIVTKMLAWKFPTPRGGVKVPVNYPFMLRPVKR